MKIAPELDDFPAICPWLTRTAGEPIIRPTWLDFMMAKIARACDDLSGVLRAFTPAIEQARQGFLDFGAALAKAFPCDHAG